MLERSLCTDIVRYKSCVSPVSHAVYLVLLSYTNIYVMADVIVQLASVRHYLLSFETVDDCNQAGKHLQVTNAANMQIYKNKEITTMQRKQVFLAITFAERITPKKVKALFPPQISYTLVKAVNILKDNGSSLDGQADFYHPDNTFDLGVYLFGKQLSKAVVADMNRQ